MHIYEPEIFARMSLNVTLGDKRVLNMCQQIKSEKSLYLKFNFAWQGLCNARAPCHVKNLPKEALKTEIVYTCHVGKLVKK